MTAGDVFFLTAMHTAPRPIDPHEYSSRSRVCSPPSMKETAYIEPRNSTGKIGWGPRPCAGQPMRHALLVLRRGTVPFQLRAYAGQAKNRNAGMPVSAVPLVSTYVVLEFGFRSSSRSMRGHARSRWHAACSRWVVLSLLCGSASLNAYGDRRRRLLCSPSGTRSLAPSHPS
jgi:hypothetical protein